MSGPIKSGLFSLPPRRALSSCRSLALPAVLGLPDQPRHFPFLFAALAEMDRGAVAADPTLPKYQLNRWGRNRDESPEAQGGLSQDPYDSVTRSWLAIDRLRAFSSLPVAPTKVP